VKGYVSEDGNLADGIAPIRQGPRSPRPAADPTARALANAVANQGKEGPPADDEIPF
jgi:hypothetical protein